MCKDVGFKAKWLRTNCLRRKMYLIRRFLFQMEEQPEAIDKRLFFEEL